MSLPSPAHQVMRVVSVARGREPSALDGPAKGPERKLSSHHEAWFRATVAELSSSPWC